MTARAEPLAGRLAWRTFVVGVFLAAFVRVRPVPGVGISASDVLIIMGGLLLIGRGLTQPGTSERPGLPFRLAGMFIVGGVLVSGLVRFDAALLDIGSLAGQYWLVLMTIPGVLALLPVERRITTAKAFVYGVATSIAVGMALLTFVPAAYSQLLALGVMDAVGSGGARPGLFTGVGELAKVAAMTIPLVYYLVVRGHLSFLRGGVLVAVLALGVVVTQAGSGAIVAVAGVGVLALMRLLVRKGGAQRNSGVKVLAALSLAIVGFWYGLQGIDSGIGSGGGFGQRFLDRVVSPLSDSGAAGVGSADLRITLAGEAWRLIGERPLLGTGPGLYRGSSDFDLGVHIVPLLLWGEIGMSGALGWLIVVLGVAVTVAQSLRRAPVAAVAGAAVLVTFIGTCLSATYFYPRPLVLPLLIVTSLMWDTEPQEVKSPKSPKRRSSLAGGAAPRPMLTR
ncbi:hypothetical protein [Blastococcus sp. SYSU DS0533]